MKGRRAGVKTRQHKIAAPSINTAALHKLRELGDDQFVVEMIEALCAFAPTVLREARAGLRAGQLEPVIRMGHSLKSSAGLLGAEAMREVASRIEVSAREGTSDDLPGLLDEMDGAFFQAKEYLLKIRNNGGKPL